ncbi:MAG: hypothetical protein K2K32_07910 [Muribaculaceae bacterium]|nr:hypothetical protein [Muribaculaceae bacterium]
MEKKDGIIQKGLIIIAVVLSILLCASAVIMFIETCTYKLNHKEIDKEWVQLRGKVQFSPYWNPKDSTVLTRQDAMNILQTQQRVLARQDVLADDLRQETNNLINKMNGWLSFWIGILALLGVFVPIALQFRLSRESSITEKELEANYQEKIKLLDKEIEKRREIDFTILVRNFHNICDCEDTKMFEIRSSLLSEIWTKIKKHVDLIIHGYCNSPDTDSNISDMKQQLTIVLIQVSNVLNQLLVLSKRHNRHLKNLYVDTGNLITSLNSPGIKESSLRETLSNYAINLRLLQIIL